MSASALSLCFLHLTFAYTNAAPNRLNNIQIPIRQQIGDDGKTHELIGTDDAYNRSASSYNADRGALEEVVTMHYTNNTQENKKLYPDIKEFQYIPTTLPKTTDELSLGRKAGINPVPFVARPAEKERATRRRRKINTSESRNIPVDIKYDLQDPGRGDFDYTEEPETSEETNSDFNDYFEPKSKIEVNSLNLGKIASGKNNFIGESNNGVTEEAKSVRGNDDATETPLRTSAAVLKHFKENSTVSFLDSVIGLSEIIDKFIKEEGKKRRYGEMKPIRPSNNLPPKNDLDASATKSSYSYNRVIKYNCSSIQGKCDSNLSCGNKIETKRNAGDIPRDNNELETEDNQKYIKIIFHNADTSDSFLNSGDFPMLINILIDKPK